MGMLLGSSRSPMLLPMLLLLLLLLAALLLLLPLRRSPTMGMLSRLKALLPLLPLPLRRPPTMGMFSRLRALLLLLLLLLLLEAPSPLRRSPTMGMLSRLRSPTMGMLSSMPCGAGAERVPAEKRATDRINELNWVMLQCDPCNAIDRSHFVSLCLSFPTGPH